MILRTEHWVDGIEWNRGMSNFPPTRTVPPISTGERIASFLWLDVHCLRCYFFQGSTGVEPTIFCVEFRVSTVPIPLGLGRPFLFLVYSTKRNSHAMSVCRRDQDEDRLRNRSSADPSEMSVTWFSARISLSLSGIFPIFWAGYWSSGPETVQLE